MAPSPAEPHWQGAPTPAAKRACRTLLRVPAMPRITLAGATGRTLLVECPGALLQFFSTRRACALRLVCRELQAAVAAHPWEDRGTVILGSIGGWRACFQRARCANVRFDEEALGWRHSPVVDGDFVHFVGLWELSMDGCTAVTDAALVHLRGIRVLDMGGCSQPTITDAGLAHLVGITRLHMEYANGASIAAARDLGLPVTTGDWTEASAFRFSDAESGPWPAGAEWA